MKKLLVLLSAMSLFFLGCAGTPQDNGEALDNALVTFTSNVQSSRWQEALSNVTPDEARQIGSSDGYEFLPEYQTAASRLPLSTLRKAGLPRYLTNEDSLTLATWFRWIKMANCILPDAKNRSSFLTLVKTCIQMN